MNQSHANSQYRYHQHNESDQPPQGGAEGCNAEVLKTFEMQDDSSLLFWEGDHSNNNVIDQDSLQNTEGNLMDTTNRNVLQADNLHGEGLNVPTTVRTLTRNQQQHQTKTSSDDFKTFLDASTEHGMSSEYNATASPRASSDESLFTPSGNRRATQTPMDQFLQEFEKECDGMKKRQPHKVSQNQLDISLVRHGLDQFITQFGSPTKDVTDVNPNASDCIQPSSKKRDKKNPSDDRFSQFIPYMDQKMPARPSEEEAVLTLNTGIVPMTGAGDTTSIPSNHVFRDENLRTMHELQENPRMVSFQDALSFTNSNRICDTIAVQDPTMIIRPANDSEQALGMVTDESVSEESATDDALADSACCLIQPLPFHLPHTLEGMKVKEEESMALEGPLSFDVKVTGMDALHPFGNLFAIEDLQKDLLGCDRNKRSLETKDDLSHRLKRVKSSHDPQDDLDIGAILAIEENMLVTKVSEQFVSKIATSETKTNKTDNPIRIKFSKKFSKMYNQCLSFRETHGHCAIPLELPENPGLAKWARTMRMAHSRTVRGLVNSTASLSEKEILELNKIGFCWNLKEYHWNATFESLRDQLRECGVAGDRQTRWLKAQQKRLDEDKLRSDQARKILSLQSGPFLGVSATTPLKSTWV
ncbi:unnamed protein product [Cylindrotheca closterium]|uniref:Helicase-associated domain-containing protein n=1 Tax=Cylindrotheca closterium TaxID=2856 RepID=A0AAD2FV23_9STRA|nr:unnamed protein product [Cylindrotheca closterium]